jgi:hypothetical protein
MWDEVKSLRFSYRIQYECEEDNAIVSLVIGCVHLQALRPVIAGFREHRR